MLRGNYRALSELSAALKGAPALKDAVAKETAKAFNQQLEYQYNTGTDPDNEGWAELAYSTLAGGRFPPPLTDTKKMRRNSKAVAGVKGVGGVSVTVKRPGGNPNVPNFHQEGTENMPARKIIPQPNQPLPSAWRAAAEKAAGKAFDKHFWSKG